jgi:hypothetical protein
VAIAPLDFNLVTSAAHFIHHATVIPVQPSITVFEDVVDGCVLLSPSGTTQGATFPMLAKQLLTWQE